KVSTGGFIEYVLAQGEEAVDHYLRECKAVGFDIVEISTGFITVPVEDIVRLTERVLREGLLAKPEVGIQFGAGGATSAEALEVGFRCGGGGATRAEAGEVEGTSDPGRATEIARRCLDAGAYMIMIESEGITENVREWRTDVVARIISELGTERVMFEAADPE